MVSVSTDSLVMTVLEAEVSSDRWLELKHLYEGSAGRLPVQMLQAFLVQEHTDPSRWRGIAVWRSRAALEEYRRSVETPGGVAMFRAVGAEPKLSLWTVATALPAKAAV